MNTLKKAIFNTAILAFIGISSSLISQYWFGMNPCVMCILQRLALIGVFIASLLTYSLPIEKSWVRFTSIGLIISPSVYGIKVAIEQIQLQAMPVYQQPSCGAPWTFRLRDAPLFNWYEWLIRGTGNCGEIQTIFNISLPIWSLLFFMVIMLIILVGWFKNQNIS